MSWGCTEFSQETQLDGCFTTPAGHAGVSFVASAGDDGVPGTWPAFSPNVVAVGGTRLQTSSASGTYRTETAWAFGGGGLSQYEREPGYQAGVQSSGVRTIPDVAYNADPQSGFAVCDSLDPYATAGWDVIGGTSAGTPQWAALLAIANQERFAAGLPTLRSAAADLYQLPIADFHDVTVGSNGFSAGPGYDLTTGHGSPYANRIVHALDSSTIGTVQGSARPVGSDLTPAALSKRLGNRSVVAMIAWDAADSAERRAHAPPGNSSLSPLPETLRVVQ
jgi:subtilase family serine protease